MSDGIVLSRLLNDGSVSDIFINGINSVYCERNGRIEKCELVFETEAALRSFVNSVFSNADIEIKADKPYADLRLPDGSRLNVIMPPAAVDGICISIRKPAVKSLNVSDFIKNGSLTDESAAFLKTCVEKRKNVIISGGTGSGKTTLLNLLSSFISPHERIITIEDAAELRLNQEHIVRLEARGAAGITIRNLVANALRMRPDRIIVGECRSGETLDMLQAMNTGHDGSLSTVHANTPRDAIKRIEVMCLMSGLDIPLRALREQISSAVNFIVQVTRFASGARKVTDITQVFGMEGDIITTAQLFKMNECGLAPTGISADFGLRCNG